MRINSGFIGMDSARTYSSEKSEVRTYSSSMFSGLMSSKEFDSFNKPALEKESDEISKKDNLNTKDGNSNIEDAMENLKSKVKDVGSVGVSAEQNLRDQIRKMREQCMNLLLRILFPDRKLNLKDEGFYDAGQWTDSSSQSSDISMAVLVKESSYSYEYRYEESETTSFSAVGKVTCADGREIDININLEMSRSFCEYYAEEMEYVEVSLMDPLILDFKGPATSLSDQTFMFDIDSDGIEDEINKLAEGSGFLALDLNEDGIINDGSELFGTRSGNGFLDLQKYDTDNDGFIDEDDEVFEKLKIMCINSDGSAQLYSLKEAGVGAIGLSSISTEFSDKSEQDNTYKGIVRSTGVFLFEDGRAGTVRQLDLVNHSRIKQAEAAYA